MATTTALTHYLVEGKADPRRRTVALPKALLGTKGRIYTAAVVATAHEWQAARLARMAEKMAKSATAHLVIRLMKS